MKIDRKNRKDILPEKHDLVVWIKHTKPQLEMYKLIQ